MNIYRNLIAFEYKKLLKKKSTVIVLVLTLLLTLLSVYGTVFGNVYNDNGEIISTRYEYLMQERENALEMSGAELDSELVMRAVDAFARNPQDINEYVDLDEAMKYYPVYEIAGNLLETNSREFSSVTSEEADALYDNRLKQLDDYLTKSDISNSSEEFVRNTDAKVITPFKLEYYGGYQRYLTIMYSTALVALSAIAIIVAPLFSGEYVSGADSIILSSKHGRGKVIGAKLFVMFSFSFALAVVLSLISIIECISLWGNYGMTAAIQLLMPNCIFPLNFISAAIMYTVCIVGACILVAALTAILSSIIKTPFGTVVIMAVFIIAPLFINVSEYHTVLFELFLLLPSNMITFWNAFSTVPYNIFGIVIPNYIFFPIFSVLVAAVLSVGSFFKFRGHNVA